LLFALVLASVAVVASGFAIRTAIGASSRTLKRTLHRELEELGRQRRDLRHDWEEQIERLTKQHRRTAQAARRIETAMGELEEPDPDQLELESGPVSRGDGTRGAGGGVLPLRPDVATIPWAGGRTG